MIKGKIKFTESGFILYPNDGDMEIWQIGNNNNPNFIYYNGVKYKWTNAPKKNIEEED
jgi:hypothetical protein